MRELAPPVISPRADVPLDEGDRLCELVALDGHCETTVSRRSNVLSAWGSHPGEIPRGGARQPGEPLGGQREMGLSSHG